VRRRLSTLAILLLATLATPAAAASPYGANDSGGFRNVLPPGTRGLDNALDFAAFNLNNQRPAHWDDALAPYVNLLYGSPHLTDAQLPRYFKDATFGVRASDVESTESPRSGLTIVRDRGSGVPHVYGTTRDDTMFGAGYVAAEDRLFLMDVLRHTGRAQLSSFAGGDPSNREMDREQWQVAPYTEAELQSQIDAIGQRKGAAGRQAFADLTAYVAGINAYISAATLDSTKMPAEYGLLQIPLQPWKATDVIATASLVAGIYGRGGGEELRSALILRAAEHRFGVRRGRAVWSDFRMRDDPEAPTTLRRRFPFRTTSPFAHRGLALPDRGSVAFAPGTTAGAFAASAPRPASRLGFTLPSRGASNALLVNARHSAGGHPIAVMGPEVGFYVPQILMEEDLHGPGVDARGAAFPGVSLYVQLGHGRDYAWSATSAYSDNVDTFAERLCNLDGSPPSLSSKAYRRNGRCVPMDELQRSNTWKPNPSDQTPPGSETLVALRTAHGIVEARARVHGIPVAYVRDRSTYFHEADSGIAFAALNDPGRTHDARSFQRAVSGINLTFNWFYADSRDTAYFSSGDLPRRAHGVSPDFPVWADPRYGWRGLISARAHPQAIDPAEMVNWNNRQAPRFVAADDDFGDGAPERSQLLEEKLRRDIRGGRRTTRAAVVSAMEETATQDLRGAKLVPILLRALGSPRDPALRGAMRLLAGWQRRGAHRRDLNRDGHYDDDAAVTLMDAWWPRLAHAEFDRALGPDVLARIQALKQIGDEKGGPATTPEFCCGWYPYVSKDLRSLFAPRAPRGALSRRYCGGGSRRRCRGALLDSLRAALHVTRADLYGHEPDCVDRHQVEASCHDLERPTVTAAIDTPNFPFAQRPTFQQVVQVPRQLPR
jgi:acyl-homoserine lactone acylase PvdQ